MIVKQREVPYLLIVFGILNTRGELTDEERGNYLNIKKGFEGELKFDLLTDKLHSEVFVINDLLLEINNTEFQIDTLLIFQGTCRVCEVKNFEDLHFYQDGKFYNAVRPKHEITNPLHQLERKVTLLGQFLRKHGIYLQIESHLIFVNPEFTLLQAPMDKPIILPTQLNRFMEQLNSTPSKLNGAHTRMADLLVDSHKSRSTNMRLPKYSYGDLRKGSTCSVCNSFSQGVSGNRLVCKDCGFEEKIEAVVMRSVQEIMVLFPEMKITTCLVWEWCGEIVSKKVIRNVLKKNLKIIGHGQWAYFV